MIRILRSDFLERSKSSSFKGGVIVTLFLAVIGTPRANSAIAILTLTLTYTDRQTIPLGYLLALRSLLVFSCLFLVLC